MMTQKEMVLKYMQDFGSITAFQAFADLGITHINGRIKELRDSGIEIKTTMVKAKNRYGKTIEYGQFSLVAKPGEQMNLF